MNMLCEPNINTQQSSPQAAKYVAEPAHNFMQYSFDPLTESQPTAGVDIVLSMNQQQTLNYLVDRGEFGARQILLIDQITKHYAQRGIPLFDLNRSVNRGITDALDKVEEVSDYCFSSYFVHCLYYYIEHMLLSRNTTAGSFQTKRAPGLSFDNPTHQRSRR